MRIAACLLTAALASTTLAAQGTSGAFVVTLGKDTVAVERYTRTADRLEADAILRDRAPVVHRHVVATLGPNGTVKRFELANRPAGQQDAKPLLAVALTFSGDTAVMQLSRPQGDTTLRVVAPGGVPYVGYSFAIIELFLLHLPATGDAKVSVLMIPIANAATYPTEVWRFGRDSAVFDWLVGPTHVRIDADGRVQGADASLTTVKVHGTRLRDIDLAAVESQFANRPLGQLSPLDSIRVTIGGAAIALDYSRPSMRGRRIFGGDPVPWNKVWRTGANFATRFTTSADLVIGGQTVPTGTYTLWTLPTPTGWKLIINKQTKAPCADAASCASPQRANLWGTDYNADSDFVRVDMQVEKLPAPVEEYVMSVAPQGAGGILKLEWETTRAWVAFTKK